MKILLETTLANTSGTYNKFYRVKVEEDNNNYSVIAEHGRIGTEGRKLTKCQTVEEEIAFSEARKLVCSKIARGYIERKDMKKQKKGARSRSFRRFSNIEIINDKEE